MIRYLDLSRCSPEVQLAARCIGLNYKRPYSRYGKAYYRPWQNRFVTSEDADVYTYWLGMEMRGLARRQRNTPEGEICFYLTDRGMDWLGKALNIVIARRPGQ